MIFIVNAKSRTHVELHSHNVFCARFLNINDDREETLIYAHLCIETSTKLLCA